MYYCRSSFAVAIGCLAAPRLPRWRHIIWTGIVLPYAAILRLRPMFKDRAAALPQKCGEAVRQPLDSRRSPGIWEMDRPRRQGVEGMSSYKVDLLVGLHLNFTQIISACVSTSLCTRLGRGFTLHRFQNRFLDTIRSKTWYPSTVTT